MQDCGLENCVVFGGMVEWSIISGGNRVTAKFVVGIDLLRRLL
jgi:hypothetical protein